MRPFILKGNRNLSLVFRKFLLLTTKNILFLVILHGGAFLLQCRCVKFEESLIRGLSMVSFLMQECLSLFIKSKDLVNEIKSI